MSVKEYVEKYEERKKELAKLLDKLIQAVKITYKDFVAEYVIDEEGLVMQRAHVILVAVKMTGSTEAKIELYHLLVKNGFVPLDSIGDVHYFIVRRVY